MKPCSPRTVRALLVQALPLVAVAGCNDPAPPAPASPTASTPVAEAKPPAPAEAKPPAPAPAETKATPPAPADAGEPAGEDWLVFREDAQGQWITRWVDAAEGQTTDVAERKALVLSDGNRLWLVERADGEADVVPCACLDTEELTPAAAKAACAPAARIATLGLRATELGSGQVTPIHGIAKPGAPVEPIIAEGISTSLDVHGGAGSLLFFGSFDSGYYCGAHGMNEGSEAVFDAVTGEQVGSAWKTVDGALPLPLRTAAATEIQAQLRECGEETTLEAVRDEEMQLTGLHVGLVDGEPKLTWQFEAETYYACSTDYAAHGQAGSGLLPAAASLGLDGPLPAGVQRVLAELGSAPTVGWARLSLHGAERVAARAAFERAAETPWPPSTASDHPIVGAEAQARTKAKVAVEEGRTLTRAGDFAAAIAQYDLAIELDPTLSRAWSERGYARLLAGDFDAAKADLDAALPLDEGAGFRAAVRFNLGQVAEKRGDATTAAAEYEASLALREHEGVRKALARVKAP